MEAFVLERVPLVRLHRRIIAVHALLVATMFPTAIGTVILQALGTSLRVVLPSPTQPVSATPRHQAVARFISPVTTPAHVPSLRCRTSQSAPPFANRDTWAQLLVQCSASAGAIKGNSVGAGCHVKLVFHGAQVDCHRAILVPNVHSLLL